MSDAFSNLVRAAPDNVKLVFIQGVFESLGVVEVKSRTVWVPVSPSYLNGVVELLRSIGASPELPELIQSQYLLT